MNADQLESAASGRSWFRRHPVLTGFLAVLGLLLLLIFSLFLLPFSVDDTSVADPASSHEEALVRLEATQEND